ncbi:MULTISPECIES: nitrite reductase small subunit NirD [Mumia]|uniref:nitrite reductase small subunit NirD n=1 Tax=Mumia TaxID=1546255 RepID=UPI0014235CE9|nr:MULTISPECIES: nitrite reductase small subunit NirD [unclassified Mumia]QMW66908.1 nitrite reductase small subunit NirD [Mumia sp. ZJ1417]
MATSSGVATWVKVCDAGELVVGIGVSALIRGKQVALFKTDERSLRAVGNRDPYAGTQTMARGLVVQRDGHTLLAAPAGRELFDLETGQCVDDPMTRVPTYPVRVVNGFVEVCITTRG